MKSDIKNKLKHVLNRLGILTFALRMIRYIPRYPVTLMYHRLTQDDATGITSSDFEEHLIFLKKHCEIEPLANLISSVNHRTKGKRKVAITFDDGYEDFYQSAWPLIKKHQIPVTLFVTTGFIDGAVWLWPDKIHYILSSANTFTARLDGFGEFTFDRDDVLEGWNQLGDYCLTLGRKERDHLIEKLAEIANIQLPPTPLKQYKGLNWTQLKEMVEGGLQVESHTVSHPILSLLDKNDLVKELADSKKSLEKNLGKPVEIICYPNGYSQDVSQLVEEQAQVCGYKYGVMACIEGAAITDNGYRIGRVAAPKEKSNLAFNFLKSERMPW